MRRVARPINRNNNQPSGNSSCVQFEEAVLLACRNNNVHVKAVPNRRAKSAILESRDYNIKVTRNLNVTKISK